MVNVTIFGHCVNCEAPEYTSCKVKSMVEKARGNKPAGQPEISMCTIQSSSDAFRVVQVVIKDVKIGEQSSEVWLNFCQARRVC